MTTSKIIIKFEQVADQSNDYIRRLIGFVPAKYLIDLISATDLNANPRSAKNGRLTRDIIGSIQDTKDIFPFKTKGILLAVCTPPNELERKRYELSFQDGEIEGILDGGHNTLAIAIHILSVAVDDKNIVRKINDWGDLKKEWLNHHDKIGDIRDQLDFLVPVEILCPLNDSEEKREKFRRAILDICSTRNNNLQLSEDTKANQAGHYDFIKEECIDAELAGDVIWKTNEPGRIDVRDIVALSWIPLSLLKLPDGVPNVAPSMIYNSKKQCLEAFIALMKHSEVSRRDDTKFTLINNRVKNALRLLNDLPKLYDLIYKDFPEAYNKADGKFGKISCVRFFQPDKYHESPQKYLRKQPLSIFYNQPVHFQYPEAYIIPLVCALSALMKETDSGIEWAVDPYAFLAKNLSEIVKAYKGVLEMAELDPQKLGKNSMSYIIAKQQFEHFLANPNVKAA